MCLPQLRADKRFEDSRLEAGAHAWLLSRYTHDIGIIESELSDGRDFILGNKPSIADFSLYGYLVHANEANVTLPKHVKYWVSNMEKLDGWQHPYEMLK